MQDNTDLLSLAAKTHTYLYDVKYNEKVLIQV